MLEMTDALEHIVTPDPIPAGPRLWEMSNTGMHGTPPAGEPLLAQMVGVGYAALQSGGQTTWNAVDLEPGSYAVICFIIDPVTGRPHVIDGMATVFAVE